MSNNYTILMEKIEQTWEQIWHKLTIWKHSVDIPIIQGWMGVGISTAELAGNVALNGWIGTLSGTGLQKTPYYRDLLIYNIKEAKKKASSPENPRGKLTQEQIDAYLLKTQIECIKNEVKRAKEIAKGKGAIFINIMVATSNYEAQVKAACEAWVDGIVSWAGLPKHLPELTKEYPDVAIIPILSNEKGVNVLLKLREKSGRLPDAIILEDPSTAGGHLGAANVEKTQNEEGKLTTAIPAVLALLKSKGIQIPIIWAWGITNKEEMDAIIKLWASGVQVGTRFLASKESWASQKFKEAIVNATKDSIITYMSSAWLPANALEESWIFERMKDVDIKTRRCIENCLVHCWYRDGNPNLAQMCINKELVRSTAWWRWEGLMFTWKSAERIESILSVKEIMEIFMSEETQVNKQ